MGLAINWWKDGWNIDQQSHQLNFAIIDAVQMVLQTALSAITIYGNFLLLLWKDLAEALPEDVHSPYLSNLQLGSGKSIGYCKRNSRISGY
jgi:hypothetical protein